MSSLLEALTGFGKREKRYDLLVFLVWLPMGLSLVLMGSGLVSTWAAYLIALVPLWLVYQHCCPAHFADGRVNPRVNVQQEIAKGLLR